jgi:hypothetical protein
MRNWKDNIKMDLTEMGFDSTDLILGVAVAAVNTDIKYQAEL